MNIKNIIEQMKSNDPEIQEAAIRQLELIDARLSIPLLVKCLDEIQWRANKNFSTEWRSQSGESPEGRSLYEPMAYLAVKVLARIIPNSPIDITEGPITITHVNKMKNWWIKNKVSYEGGALS